MIECSHTKRETTHNAKRSNNYFSYDIQNLSPLFFTLIYMRKITTQAVNAFLNSQSFNSWNTTVTVTESSQHQHTTLALHGNKIANRIQNLATWSVQIEISNAWWFSNTTKERLNGIQWVSINQKAWQWYLNGNAWDGKWITISI